MSAGQAARGEGASGCGKSALTRWQLAHRITPGRLKRAGVNQINLGLPQWRQESMLASLCSSAAIKSNSRATSRGLTRERSGAMCWDVSCAIGRTRPHPQPLPASREGRGARPVYGEA